MIPAPAMVFLGHPSATSEDMGGDGEEAVMAVLVKPQAVP